MNAQDNTIQRQKLLLELNEKILKQKKELDAQLEDLIIEKEHIGTEKKKIEEKNAKLWEQSVAIHKEKDRIDRLRQEVEARHTEVMDSISYAKRIQTAILPLQSEINSALSQCFVLFKPRDIVSGDFYWFSQKDQCSIIAAVDCTGHGVPGAFMSMIGNTLLNQIVNEKGITDPASILDMLNEEVSRSLKQTQAGSESRDGMDVAICKFDPEKNEMQYAGANRPLYFIRGEILEETKANKSAIGGLTYDIPKKYTTHSFSLKPNDLIYIATDGYADQFSPQDKKMMTKKFKETILSIRHLSMPEQEKHLDEFFSDWKGNTEQTDDVLVIGVRI